MPMNTAPIHLKQTLGFGRIKHYHPWALLIRPLDAWTVGTDTEGERHLRAD